MSDIRTLLSRMLAEEERVLSQRRAEEAATLQRNFWLSATLAALVAALLIAVYALIRRESAVRARAAEQLERTNASLAEANAARARLLAAASHDLRQPLQTLTLLNATLKEEPLSPLAARIVETQTQTLGSMSRLVHALLNINRLESGTMRPEIRDVDLGAMLRQLRNELLPLACARRLSLEVEDGDVWVRSDATLLREILQNLLSKAASTQWMHADAAAGAAALTQFLRPRQTLEHTDIPAASQQLRGVVQFRRGATRGIA